MMTSVRISSGAFLRYAIPSSLYNSRAAMTRSPFTPSSRTLASSAMVTGAVSVDDAAQQRGEPGATRQMSPSFFMQKPMDFRQK